MHAIFRDELFDSQWQRTAGHASYGGAELGECLAIARRIREPDGERWFEAWAECASRLAQAAGNVVSARDAWLRASNYWRAAYTFLIGPGQDTRVKDAYRRQRHTFMCAMELMDCSVERLAIPYDTTPLSGHFFQPLIGTGPRPTLIINGGYDSTAEECWFFSGAAALSRGYNCVLFDGPGQGGAIIEHGQVFRPDWEAIVSPVLDVIASRSEVDRRSVALLGISFGGYLAARGAVDEPRLEALALDPGEYSLWEEMLSRMPAFMHPALDGGAPVRKALLRQILRRRLEHPAGGWGLRRGLWVHGVDDPLDYLCLTRDYTLEGLAARITCPTLVCTAEDDDIGISAGRLLDYLHAPKSVLRFSRHEGAGNHCEVGARKLFNQRLFDWLRTQLP